MDHHRPGHMATAFDFSDCFTCLTSIAGARQRVQTSAAPVIGRARIHPARVRDAREFAVAPMPRLLPHGVARQALRICETCGT
jgi:hypothetical protein